MKYLLIILFTGLPYFKMMAQDTIRVFINNVKTASAIIKPGDTTAVLSVKKSNLKNLKSIFIQVSGRNVRGEIYKHSLEIVGGTSFFVDEAASKPGQFNMLKTNIKKELDKGKPVSFYLLLNPANPDMMMPSKRIFVGKLVII
jgi:hypothetical protein